VNQHRSPFIPAPLEAPLKKLPLLVLLSLAACSVFTGGTEPAQAVTAQDGSTAATAPPMVTIVMSRSEISAADQLVAGPVSTCFRDDKNIAPMNSMVLPWIAANAPKVHLTGSIETKPTDGVTSTTKPYWCTHYGESVAPSWTKLQSWASQYDMHFISHSADYPQNWTTVPNAWVDPYGGSDRLADWQNWETCGSRDAITDHGLLGADGEFFWPNQKTDPTVMTDDVNQCFYMNRSYKAQTTFINTAASVEANQNIAYTRQLLGGSCSEVTDPSNTCRTPVPGCSTRIYTVPRQVINLINNLQPGQDLNLQAYVLVRNSNPTNGVNQYKTNADRWDCTADNPAYHWSNDAERYCWVDFQRIIKAIQNNPNVVVTDPEGVAQNWGMSPPTR
jgi:hypothetical protein